MKHLLFLFVFVLSGGAYSQESLNDLPEERLVNLTSTIIDYEIHNDKLVALTRKGSKYYLYFSDTKGAKLLESLEIFFPTGLEIDCMNNLFVVGVDSAVQINITDYVSRVQSLDLNMYNASIRTCQAYFETNLVRTSYGNTLLYEPLEDSLFKERPVIQTIQVWSGSDYRLSSKSPRNRNTNQTKELGYNNQLNIHDDVLSNPYPTGSSKSLKITKITSLSTPCRLSAFQRGDSLWVIAERSEILLVYSDSGKCASLVRINGLPFKYRIEQDMETSEVFILSTNSSTTSIQKVNRNGELDSIGTLRKGLRKSDLKISNGYLYFRDSKGKGESIKRVKLN